MIREDVRVKGSVLRGVLRDAKEQPGGIPALLERVPGEVRERHFGKPIFHGIWYPYEALVALLDAYARLPGNAAPGAFRRMGERMAERDLSTLLKAYALISTPLQLARVPERLWRQRFRGAGESHCEAGDHEFRFTIEGFPDMHPRLCELLTGFGEAVGRHKAPSFANTHDRCVHRGDRHCSWLSTW